MKCTCKLLRAAVMGTTLLGGVLILPAKAEPFVVYEGKIVGKQYGEESGRLNLHQPLRVVIDFATATVEGEDAPDGIPVAVFSLQIPGTDQYLVSCEGIWVDQVVGPGNGNGKGKGARNVLGVLIALGKESLPDAVFPYDAFSVLVTGNGSARAVRLAAARPASNAKGIDVPAADEVWLNDGDLTALYAVTLSGKGFGASMPNALADVLAEELLTPAAFAPSFNTVVTRSTALTALANQDDGVYQPKGQGRAVQVDSVAGQGEGVDPVPTKHQKMVQFLAELLEAEGVRAADIIQVCPDPEPTEPPPAN